MNRKIEICLIVFALIGLLIGGTSIAYFTDDIKATEVKFVAGKVKIDFQGIPEVDALTEHVDNQRVTWTITNTGGNSVFLRVRPVCEIDLETEGDIKLEAYGTTWQKGDDDYYYYPEPVKPQETIGFCLEVVFDIWDSVGFPVDIEAEAIQESNNAINEIWPDNPFK